MSNANKIELLNDQQSALLEAINEHVTLDNELQKENTGKMFFKAMNAISELRSNERSLIRHVMELQESIKTFVKNEHSIVSRSLRMQESSKEILNDYIEIYEREQDNLNTYQHNEELLFAEIDKVRLAKHSELAREMGSKKNAPRRNMAYELIRRLIASEPGLSINRLAAIVESESGKKGSRFDRQIPLSTGRDYARKIKSEIDNSN